MKYIQKGDEPGWFSKWKEEFRYRFRKRKNSEPNYDSDFKDSKVCKNSGDKKQSGGRALREELLQEQGYLCCYCENRIEIDSSHNDHFKSQKSAPHLVLDYQNLLCSCGPKKKKGDPKHCGDLKDWPPHVQEHDFDDNNLISPLDLSCESRFKFTRLGRIEPADITDLKAQETIDRLGLNDNELVRLRLQVIQDFEEDEAELTEEEFIDQVNQHLSKSEDGKFGRFWTTIKQFFAPQ